MEYTFLEKDLDELLAEFPKFDTFAIDIETSGLSPIDSRMMMCQIGFPNDTQFVIDARVVDLKPLLPFLASREWKKLFFNGVFEGTFFYHYFDTPINHVFDSYVAERILYPDNLGGNSFEDLALKYLNVQLDKQTRKSFLGNQTTPFTEKQKVYGAEDVKYLFPLYDIQRLDLRAKKSEHIADLENDLVTVVAHMELTGVPVDAAKWLEILQEYVIEHEESRKKLLGLFLGKPPETFEKLGVQQSLFDEKEEVALLPNTLNLNSPPQLKKAFANLGVYLESTDEQVIALINHPAAQELVNYRGLQKLISSYGQESFLDKIHPFTGRIHPNWQQLGAETGRFSCRKPNMQQIPEKLRKAVGGAGELVLLGADFSQMELRILAQESGDPILMEAFLTGQDVHTLTASMMFGIPTDKVTKEQRFTAKTLNFGITYGMKVKKFTDSLNIEAQTTGNPPVSMANAGKLMDLYKRTYIVANKYLESQGLFALRHGYTETRFGRKRWFKPAASDQGPKKYAGQIEAIKRAGANMGIQGGNADITKMAMIEIHNELREYKFKANIVLQVHDEIVLLTHKSQVDIVKPIVVDSMVRAGKMLLPDVPVVVDAYEAEYWPK